MRFGALGVKVGKSKTLILTESVQNIKRKSKRPARLLPLKYILYVGLSHNYEYIKKIL